MDPLGVVIATAVELARNVSAATAPPDALNRGELLIPPAPSPEITSSSGAVTPGSSTDEM